MTVFEVFQLIWASSFLLCLIFYYKKDSLIDITLSNLLFIFILGPFLIVNLIMVRIYIWRLKRKIKQTLAVIAKPKLTVVKNKND